MASADQDSPLQSYFELLRLPDVFTAVADVAMGFFFIRAAWAFSDDPQKSLLPIGLWTIARQLGIDGILVGKSLLPIGLWTVGLLAGASALRTPGWVGFLQLRVHLDAAAAQLDGPFPRLEAFLTDNDGMFAGGQGVSWIARFPQNSHQPLCRPPRE